MFFANWLQEDFLVAFIAIDFIIGFGILVYKSEKHMTDKAEKLRAELAKEEEKTVAQENPDNVLNEKLEKIKDLGYSPQYSGKPIRIYLCAQFVQMVVALDYIDLPLRAGAAIYKGKNQFIVDPRNIAFHSHREHRSFIFMDIHTNLPLNVNILDDKNYQPNYRSSELFAIYGAQENFRQFIAGIRQLVQRNTRQIVVLAIVFFVVGALTRFL